MAIDLIIDGYNLIRFDPELAEKERLEMEAGRDALAALLSRYRKAKPGVFRLTVVFDAAANPRLERKTRRISGIEFHYSRPAESADDAIRALVRSKKNAEIVMVTDDRALADSLRSPAVSIVGCREFLERVAFAEYAFMKGLEGDQRDAEDADAGSKKKPTPGSRKLPKSQRKDAYRKSKL